MMDGGARFTGFALQASMLDEVLRAFAATDFSSPPLPADPADGRPSTAVSPNAGPAGLAPGSLTVRGADGAVRDLPPADARWAGSASEPDPARSLAGLRAPTRAGETSDMAVAAGAGADRHEPAGAPSLSRDVSEPEPPGRSSAPVEAARPRPAPDRAPAEEAPAADPAENRPGRNGPSIGTAEAAGAPAAPVRREALALEGELQNLDRDRAPDPVADGVLPTAGQPKDPAERATAAPPPVDASRLDEAGRSDASTADARRADSSPAAVFSMAMAAPVTRRAGAADIDFRDDGSQPDRAEAGGAPGQPAAPHPTAEPLPPIRHAALRDLDLRFFSDAASGAPMASGSLDAAVPAAMLVFNAAMIPGWPPPRPFDMPNAEEMLARLTGSPLVAGHEDELEARLGTPALAGAATRLLRRLPRSRRLRALLGLAALMDTVEAVIEAVEGELLELARARRENDEDWSEAGAGRRWTA